MFFSIITRKSIYFFSHEAPDHVGSASTLLCYSYSVTTCHVEKMAGNDVGENDGRGERRQSSGTIRTKEVSDVTSSEVAARYIQDRV